jgi:hypothetical protein
MACMADQLGDGGYLNFQVSNEYFHTVLINVLWHEGELTVAMLTKESWYPGTGFFYRVEGRDFLGTARHIFSARTWRENKWRDYEVAPTHIRIDVRAPTPAEGFDATSLGVYSVIVPLLDDHGTPLWFEHPQRSYPVDVAALPLAGLLDTSKFHYLPIEPDGPSRIQGFGSPRTYSSWAIHSASGTATSGRCGSVAQWHPSPRSTSRSKERRTPCSWSMPVPASGQSGSPVFLVRRTFAEDTGEQELPRTRFVGVYSGRANDEIASPSNPLPADLGFVWHAGEVDRICLGNVCAKM